MPSLRALAAAQTVPIRGDVGANLERHLGLVHLAADAGARVIVFPELSLTGYELDLASELAFAERDPRLAPLAALAASRDATLVVGAPVRLGSRLHIGAFVLSPDGRVGLYTKRRLGAFPQSADPGGVVPPAEASLFAPGDRNPLVRLGGHIAAVAVCADTGDPAHPRAAAARGATTYLASMFVIPADYEKETASLAAYAAEHAMAAVLANYGGPTGGLPAAGGSAIWSPRGELLARLATSGDGVVVARETAAGWRAEAIVTSGATPSSALDAPRRSG